MSILFIKTLKMQKKFTKKTSATIKKVSGDKHYYVRVRAYRTDANAKKVFGKVSNVAVMYVPEH